jgi:hypothetical protein
LHRSTKPPALILSTKPSLNYPWRILSMAAFPLQTSFRTPQCRVQYRMYYSARTTKHAHRHTHTLGLPQVICFTTLATRHSNTNLLTAVLSNKAMQTRAVSCPIKKTRRYLGSRYTQACEISTLIATETLCFFQSKFSHNGAH